MSSEEQKMEELHSTKKITEISEGKSLEIKVATQTQDFPYDLNTLFNFNFSMGFDSLKHSIEYLARQ